DPADKDYHGIRDPVDEEATDSVDPVGVLIGRNAAVSRSLGRSWIGSWGWSLIGTLRGSLIGPLRRSLIRPLRRSLIGPLRRTLIRAVRSLIGRSFVRPRAPICHVAAFPHVHLQIRNGKQNTSCGGHDIRGTSISFRQFWIFVCLDKRKPMQLEQP